MLCQLDDLGRDLGEGWGLNMAPYKASASCRGPVAAVNNPARMRGRSAGDGKSPSAQEELDWMAPRKTLLPEGASLEAQAVPPSSASTCVHGTKPRRLLT